MTRDVITVYNQFAPYNAVVLSVSYIHDLEAWSINGEIWHTIDDYLCENDLGEMPCDADD